MSSNTPTPIIESLKKIQKKKKLTDELMAQQLGCTRQLYQATKTGKIPVGITILKGAVRTFPELKESALIFLSGEAQGLTISENLAAEAHQTPSDGKRRALRVLARVFTFGFWSPKAKQATKSKSGGRDG